MRAPTILTVLSTLLMVETAVAEPIPIYAKTQIEDGTHIVKRMEAKLFEKDGWGVRYWAWAKLSYDSEWNSDHEVKSLKYAQTKDAQGNNMDRPWSHLAGTEADLQGTGPSEPSYDSGLAPEGTSQGNTDMHAIVAVDRTKKEIIVSFKGTDSLTSAYQDIKIWLDEAPALKGKVSRGFRQSWESVRDNVLKWLDNHRRLGDEYDIVIVGHSLGGATALVATADLLESRTELKGRMWVFTYGAPRAGDLDFQKNLENQLGDRIFNFRHEKDPVTVMPRISDGYSNPSARYVFGPKTDSDSWLDKGKWKHEPSADEDTAGYNPVWHTVEMMLGKDAFHTGYFQEDKVRAKRDVDDEEPKVHRHHKRQAPTEDELQKADDYITKMKNDSELREPSEDVPESMRQVAYFLHVEDDVHAIWKKIQDTPNQDERELVVDLLRTVSEEQA